MAAHTGPPWRVAFGGFAPGFAYLIGGDPRLRVPRRDRPRPSVPAGAVGLAGEFSGVYPRSSPGGWQLIGTTEAVLWDVDRDPPALLRPGATVRFVDAGALVSVRSRCWPPGRSCSSRTPVARASPRSGSGAPGAADRAPTGSGPAWSAIPSAAPSLEVLLGGLVVRAASGSPWP